MCIAVITLSLSNKELLISCLHKMLYIYSHEGLYISAINIKEDSSDSLLDAKLTPLGNIIYITQQSKKVVVMSVSGIVNTTHSRMPKPRYLSVSNDANMYLADEETGVYWSTNDGISWSIVFKPTDEWHCLQVMKVSTDHNDDFWTLVTNKTNYYRRVYSLERGRVDGNVTWKNINVAIKDCIDISLTQQGLFHDGNMNFFITDPKSKAIHVWSAIGRHQCELLSSQHIRRLPTTLAVDKERQLLYVGQTQGVVQVFKLIYG